MKHYIHISNEQEKENVTTELCCLVKASIYAALAYEDFEALAEVSVTFTDNEGIREINREHRDIDSATDVLSFPMLEDGDCTMDVNHGTGAVVLGDIVISLERAREQANAILASAKASSEFVFNELGRLQKEKDKADAKERLEKSRAGIRDKLKSADDEIYNGASVTVPVDEDYALPRPLEKGDSVLMVDINKKGIVVSVEGKKAVVQAGIIKTKTLITNLRLLEENVEIPDSFKEKKQGDSTLRAAVKNEIDLRGETGDDAWFMVDRYLDSAVTAGYSTVTLIHGKGTGALRAALWRYMRGDKRIKSFRSGRYGEGDTGVTVVELTGKHK